uniref:3'-N-debenzoyl-2'-deoxytaxol N-benzoyltransferase n=1 Tax=Noccaea caerulescens TaxID=107243 RepID=A0A1J3D5U4_NOCCA
MGSEDSSCVLIVEKSEVVLVKPSKPTPDVSLSLSTIDNDPLIEMVLKTICVYAPKPYLEDQANHDPASLLQMAISGALSYYYPLAGKIHRKPDDNRIQLNCKAGDGVPFIRATASCTLASLNYLDSAGDVAYQLVPCNEPVKGCEGYDPLAFQVTTFACGGITIGMAHAHAVCDGVGVAQFFRAMIELASGKKQPSVIPVWDRERLTFNGKPGGSVDLPNVGSSLCTDDMVREILTITSDNITKLKKKIAEDEQFTNDNKEKKVVVTTLEILAAHVWRARCRALNMSPNETLDLGLAIGIRGIMEPPLPEGYYGNAFLSGFVTLTARELSESSLSRIVGLIKDMKRAALDKRFVLGQLSDIEGRVKVMPTPENIGIGTMVLSDWRQIGLHYDGWGGLVNIIPLIPMNNPFFWILLPVSKAVPEMKGGVRVMVTLPREAMAKFKEEIDDCSLTIQRS